MTEFRHQMIPTSHGDVACYTALANDKPTAPAIVLIHGAMRHSGSLAHWAARLADLADVVLLDLPGHGRSTAQGPSTIEGLADTVNEALHRVLPDRGALLVGESLGGTVALEIGGRSSPVRSVLAADPPLTTGKLWNVHQAFGGVVAAEGEPSFFARIGRDVFGMDRSGEFEERIYYPLVAALRVPTVIAAGDLALLPPRRMSGVATLVDAVDRFVLTEHYADKAEVATVPSCGHLLLVDAQDACEALIRRMFADMAADAPAS